MAKKVDYKLKTNIRCKAANCTEFLKQNLVSKDPDAKYCFKHHQVLVKKNPRYKMNGTKVIKLPNSKKL
jgi:hypothetical protein